MYLEYFGLSEKPFQITPDPRFLFMSRRHRDGFAHLLYGADEAGGFVMLTGEVGTGKTTLCRSVLASTPENVHVALILNPKQSPIELVASICDELHVAYPRGTRSLKNLVDRLNLYLLRAYGQGHRTVVVIDEAQNLAQEVLEQVRLLTNLEVSTHKLLQIILIGQPELQEMLDRPELRQLAQRITARFHLTPLGREETGEYISHRLKVAGLRRQVFTTTAVQEVFKVSGGIPRLINTICERSMIGAYGMNVPMVSKEIVANAAEEVLGKRVKSKQSANLWKLGTVVAASAVLAVSVWGVWQGIQHFSITEPESIVSDETPVNNVQSDDVIAQTASTDLGVSEFASLLNDPQHQADTLSAFESLFGLWQVDYLNAEGSTACTKAVNAGLRCIFGRSDWDTVERTNRPAVLELKDKDERLRHVTLLRLRDDIAEVRIGDKTLELDKRALAQYWTGAYIALWRPPLKQETSLTAGTDSPDVLWLRHRLDEIEGLPLTDYAAENFRFDDTLIERVKAFQARVGLVADGVVGRETIIAIANVAEDASIPKLQSAQASKG